MLTGSANDGVYRLPDGSRVWFGEGPGTRTHQDEWCVYFASPDGTVRIPKDEDYFADLKDIANKYGAWEVYKAFLSIYDLTTPIVESTVLSHIETLSGRFPGDELALHRTLAILYFTMIAEENKLPARRWPLKKRVKKLGVYELVLCDYSPRRSANASRWPETAASNLARLARYESEEKARLAREASQPSSSF
jgi:hypothetical protein